MKKQYNVESYWSEVASRIAKRKKSGLEHVDDEPYYEYKRIKFLKMLNAIEFTSKNVLEVGCGPGGNLIEIFKRSPLKLTGVDVSNEMVELARKNCPPEIRIIKIDGYTLPFDDDHFDIVFTATVLQHNTDQDMLRNLIKEICRVSRDSVFLFERIEDEVIGDELNEGRPVSFYSNIMSENGFVLTRTEFINIRSSYYLSGAIRKVLNRKNRREGEPLNKVSVILQRTFLPVTKQIDKIWKSNSDLAKLEFKKLIR